MRVFLPLLLLLPSPVWAANGGESSANPWWGEVSARIRDGAHAFYPDGEGWAAGAPEAGLRGTFDLEGARLGHDGAQLNVRTARWGRPDALEEVRPTGLGPGACEAGQEDPAGACVRSLAYQSAGLTEAWLSTDQGFEQRWTVDTPPEGEGKLVLDIAVEGAAVSMGEDALWLDGEDGEAWVVSGFAAWDAEGKSVALSLAALEGGFRVVLDDETARYPVTVDPVYETAATTLIGEAEDDEFGFAVAGAGDVNGDGYDDVIVGAYGWTLGASRAYIFEGSAAGISSAAATILNDGGSGLEFGRAVAGVGDTNGDGYDDVLVGAPTWCYDYGSEEGQAFVFLGSAGGVSTTAGTTLTGEDHGDDFGCAVAGAGDVNGDGYNDVLVGAYGFQSETGRAYVYLGSATGIVTTPATTLMGESEGDDFGLAVAGAGDVNGDGYDDIIIGAEGYGRYYEKIIYMGRAYVYQGSASGISATATTTLTGESDYGFFGGAVSHAGDVNGDRYDDVAVGMWGWDEAYIYYGSSAGLNLTSATVLAGKAYSDFGWSVSGAGDVNGDAYDDVIMGAPTYGTAKGRAYVFEGSPCGISGTVSTTLTGDTDNASFGTSVSGAGDVNGDGYADVIVGAPGHDENTGQAGVYLGKASEFDTADTGVSDTGCGDSGTDTGEVDTSDSDTAGSDSGPTDTDSGDSEDTVSDSAPTADDTGATADDPAKDIPDCGCTTNGSSQSAWVLPLLSLIALRRRTRTPTGA